MILSCTPGSSPKWAVSIDFLAPTLSLWSLPPHSQGSIPALERCLVALWTLLGLIT
jgi:hypothetical protein